MSDSPADNSVRNPKKKRGRPPGGAVHRSIANKFGKNQADLITAVTRRLADGLQGHVDEADADPALLQVLAAVARFPEARQPAMLAKLRGMGARAAKRYAECLSSPPDEARVARAVLKFVAREFPPVPAATVAAALRALADRLDPELRSESEGNGEDE